MNKILGIILLLLMILVGGKRAIKSYFALCLNFILLIITFYLIACGLNPIVTALVGCGIVSFIVLFFVNGKNIKTKSSLQSIFIVLLLLAMIIFLMSNASRIGGFGYEEYEEINMFSFDIKINMNDVAVSLILIGLIGATIDSSIAVSSALYEIYYNNKHLSKKELFFSGLNVGKDILCTTANTLLFAFLGEFMTLVIWFKSLEYSLINIINSKVFCSEYIKIIFSTIGCILVIPITAYITSYYLKKENSIN